MRPLHRRPACTLAAVALATLSVGCGATDLVPPDAANRIDAALGRVADRTASGDCAGATAALKQAQDAFGDLPASVDTGLRQRIADGLSQLSSTVPAQCDAAGAVEPEPAPSTPSTPTTPAAPTDTTPTDTTPTTPTDTVPTTPPTDTTPTVPPTETVPAEPPADPAPPADGPAGGVSPDAGVAP